jgi:hypothetical protein
MRRQTEGQTRQSALMLACMLGYMLYRREYYTSRVSWRLGFDVKLLTRTTTGWFPS